MNNMNHSRCERLLAKGDSCGAIVLRSHEGEQEVLMLSHGSRGWVFPKNRQEEGESEENAAIREVRDCAGIEIKIVPGFRFISDSGLKNDGRKMIYFLAEPITQELTVKDQDPDHSAPAWQKTAEAASLLRFQEDLPALTAAMEYQK